MTSKQPDALFPGGASFLTSQRLPISVQTCARLPVSVPPALATSSSPQRGHRLGSLFSHQAVSLPILFSLVANHDGGQMMPELSGSLAVAESGTSAAKEQEPGSFSLHMPR